MKIFTILLLLVFLFGSPVYGNTQPISINPKDLVALYKDETFIDYSIIDLRDKKSYKESRIPDSVNIPLETLKFTRGLSSSGKNIIVYAETDEIAKQGVNIFKKRGIKAMYLVDGLEGWIKAGGSVDTDVFQEGLPEGFIVPRGTCEPLPPAMTFDE